MTSIDLNADIGEGDRYDGELLRIVSSCNIACGGHAGDADCMQETIASAIMNNVAIGAHPSYPDREGFGRRSNFLAGEPLRASLQQQIDTLQAAAARQGTALTHVKPHGALYNDAVNNAGLAELLVDVTTATAPGAAFVGLPHSEMQQAAARRSLPFIGEGFVDRAYQPNGELVPRSGPGAVHEDIEKILQQALELVGAVDTLCIHGDTPGAADVARAVQKQLLSNGIEIRAVSRR